MHGMSNSTMRKLKLSPGRDVLQYMEYQDHDLIDDPDDAMMQDFKERMPILSSHYICGTYSSIMEKNRSQSRKASNSKMEGGVPMIRTFNQSVIGKTSSQSVIQRNS